MTKNKIIDLNAYKNQKILDQQLEELDRIGREQYHSMSPVEQRGYRNFMKLLKAVDEKYSPKKTDS
jgi:hypothetical protein